MATLCVRDVSDEIYEALRGRASQRRTSTSAEVIRLIERGLRTDRLGVEQILDRVEAARVRVRPGAPSAAELIRQNRDER